MVGKHQGLWNHTLGQRKGLGVAWSEPLYVIGKDRSRNRLLVGTKEQTVTMHCRTSAPNVFLAFEDWPAEVLVQTIYRQKAVPAHVTLTPEAMHIGFATPHPLPSPGQIAAVYSPEGRVLAGGILTEGNGDIHAA